MRSWIPLAVVGLACLAASSGRAQAQASHRYERKGFWFSGGLGYGSAGVGCTGCFGLTREDGVSGFLALGGTVSRHLLLGFESNGWTKSEGGATVSLGTGALSARIYPSVKDGLFVRVGAGLAGETVSASGSSDTHTGFGMSGGLGYDIPVGRKVAITPVAGITAGWLGRVGGVSNYHFDVLQVAIGVTLP